MSTATATAPVRPRSHEPLSRLTFGGLLRSEWIKLRSLRSTFWCYALILVLNVGFTFLIAVQDLTGDSTRGPGQAASGESHMAAATLAVTLGLNFTALIAAVLGALVITGEYGTGMIRSTFAADPKRLGAVFAKALVFGVITFVVGIVSLLISTIIATPLLKSSSSIDLDWSNGTFWLAVVGGAGYLALAGLLAFFLGAIIRASAGGIAAGIGLLFVINIVAGIIVSVTNAKWASNISAFLPSNAGGLMFGYGSGTGGIKDGLITLDQTQGFLVMLGWVVLAGILAVVSVKRRDV